MRAVKMTQPRHLQELEETIRQRRNYLQGQDNQIQRNQTLLQTQQTQLGQNQAALVKQALQLKRYTIDTTKALQRLRKQAESRPSARHIELTKQCGELASRVGDLLIDQKRVQEFINGASDTLSSLDVEIIEADGIHKDLLAMIVGAKKHLKLAERDATFQVAIVSDLKNDVKELQNEYKALEAAKIYTTQEKEGLDKQVKQAQARLDTITAELSMKEAQLKLTATEASKAAKVLSRLGVSDKEIREGLATKKLKLQEEEDQLKAQKAEMKQALIAEQQQKPKLTVPKRDNSRGYYKI